MRNWFPAVENRLVDLAVFGRLAGSSSVQLNFSTASPTGRPAVGPEKLAQQVLIQLFSVTRDVRYTSVPGTVFMDLLSKGRTRTLPELRQAFAKAREQILAYQADYADFYGDLPADEQLADLTLTGITRITDGVALQIEIKTVAGAALTLQAPVGLPRGN